MMDCSLNSPGRCLKIIDTLRGAWNDLLRAASVRIHIGINKCRSKETPRGVESAPLTPGGLARRLVSLLDGTRDRAALVEGLLPLIDSGEATVKVDNQPVMDRTAARFLMEEQLEEALTNIARIPLLIG